MDFRRYEEKIIEIVKEAAHRFCYEKYEITEKNGYADIVTSADIAIQAFLKQRLTELIPNAGFLCEEGDEVKTRADALFIIDPIDGTTNFARGLPSYAISTALLIGGEVVVGVVYNPALDTVYSATRGGGARKNGQAISVSKRCFSDSLLLTAMSLYKKELAEPCGRVIMDAYRECNDVRRLGGCAQELCYIAEGKCELYFEIRVFPWDFAAAYLILTESGGVLTSLYDEPSFDRPIPLIGANSKENHEKLLSIVRSHINKIPY